MAITFARENARERERLSALIDRMTDQDLRLSAGDGWTISALLAHVAFWDYRALVLLKRWKKTGVGPSPMDVDAINDAVLPLCLVIAPRAAANLALCAAEAVDKELESASPEMIAAIEALGKFRLERWQHRREHREQIEQILEGQVAPGA